MNFVSEHILLLLLLYMVLVLFTILIFEVSIFGEWKLSVGVFTLFF